MELASRQLATLLAAAVLLSTAIGFAFGQLGDEQATAASGSSAIVSQLKTLNRNVAETNDRLGTSEYDIGSIHGTLKDICVAVNGSTSGC